MAKWQREISIVGQDTFLLNDSIINNIKFGLRKVSFKDIKKACIDSGSLEFVENLPNSYDTIIGERGYKLVEEKGKGFQSLEHYLKVHC